jgi:ABC-type multidrug transport system ATPase subunit
MSVTAPAAPAVSFRGVHYDVPSSAAAGPSPPVRLWRRLRRQGQGQGKGNGRAAPPPLPPPGRDDVDVEAAGKRVAEDGNRDSAVGPVKRILKNVSGCVRAGQSLAIIGASGSGKTSTLNLLSGRSAYPLAAGTVLFGGVPRNSRTKRSLGYVMQDDVFFSRLTVRETLDFTAAIRLSGRLTPEEQAAKVDDVVARLRLQKCQHTRIGDQQFDKGISGGERKRLNIGNELLTQPSVLLLDEPTSGLDASTAMAVVRLLRDLADDGMTVISTIHQPSSAMFALFDKVMLLCDGEVAYCGPTSAAEAYFARIGLPFPSNYNPCDFMMQLVIDDNILSPSADARGSLAEANLPASESARQYLVRIWQHHAPEFDDDDGDSDAAAAGAATSRVCTPHSAEPHSSGSAPSRPAARGGMVSDVTIGMRRAVSKRIWDVTGKDDPTGLPDKYQTGWWRQVRVLGLRAMRQKRGNVLDKILLSQVVAIIALAILFWWRMGDSEAQLVSPRAYNLFPHLFLSLFFFSLSLSLSRVSRRSCRAPVRRAS